MLPALWIAEKINKPSDLFCIILYLLIYIPPLFVMYHTTIPELSPDEVQMLNIYLLIGMVFVSIVPRLPNFNFRRMPVTPQIFIAFLTFFSIGLVVYLVATLGRYAHFTLDFVEVYDVRAAVGEAASAGGSAFASYATNWLSGFVFPLCFAIGIQCRKRWLVATGILAPLFLYTLTAMKSTLFTPLYMLLIYLLLRYKRERFTLNFTVGYIVILSVGIVLNNWISGDAAIAYSALVHVRIFSIPAQLIAQYYDFFNNNPVTYLSHVKGFNLLNEYPYSTDLSHMLGDYYYGSPELGSNAGFWAADGLSGFGSIGIIYLSIVCGGILWLLDSLAVEFDERFMALLCSYLVIVFSCVSLFTTILSGGLVFVFLALICWPETGGLCTVLKVKSGTDIWGH
ncbi:MAG: hypothetical protein HXX11_16470 [Desulfuromonadales bacterium]|nr:hypothetical protein [Desulfuromonadales bacterium]